MKRLGALVVLFALTISLGRSQSPNVDSLQSVLSNSASEKRVEVLHALIINLWLNYPDTAMRYAREAIALSSRLNNLRLEAISVRLLGGVHLYQGTYDSALYYSKRAHNLSLRTHDSTLISSTLNNIGFAYYHLGSYPEAMENLLRSLNLKIKIKQDYGLGQALNNVGLVYFRLNDFKTARHYFYEAIQVSERLKDRNIKLYSLNNIGFTYLEQGNFSEAERYFKASLEVAKTISNKNWHATAYSGIAQAYYRMGLIDRARRQFKVALSLRTEIGDRNGISEIYYYLSKMYATSGYLDSAFYYVNASQRIVDITKAKGRLLQNYELYKELYTQRRQYDSALFYLSQYVELRENLFNENSARNLADVQLRIQEEETLKRLAAKDIQIERKTLQTYFFSITAILTFAFALIVYWYYKIQKRLGLDLVKKNSEVLQQKEEIESQKEALVLSNIELEKAHDVIKEQNLELAELNSRLQSTVDLRTQELEQANRELQLTSLELDNFIYKSSHDIKGPLVRLLGVCHVALLDVKDPQAREYLQMLNQTALHLNDIFDRLKLVSDINAVELSNTRIDFNVLMDRVKKNLQSFEGFNQIAIREEIHVTSDFYSDEFLVETILQNMLENAVKFQKKSTEEDKFIHIRITCEHHVAVMSFIDNGIGIKETEIDQIFKMFSKAALEHQTVGLGLYIVKQCISKLGGTISLQKNPKRFTEFEVKLPGHKNPH